MEPIDSTTRTLEYSPNVPLHQRRIIRRALWGVAFLAIAVFAWQYAWPFTQQLRYLYWQSRCMSFVAPADLIGYEEDPTRAAALLAQPGYQPANPIVRQVPAGTQAPVGFVPPPLSRLSAGWVCMAFVGARTSAGGQERLVVLGYQVQLDLSTGSRRFDMYGSGKVLATLRLGSEIGGSGGGVTIDLAPADSLQLFWGQRDLKHEDRFSIDYILNGQRGAIDGRLLTDGKLELIVREGPLQARAQPY